MYYGSTPPDIEPAPKMTDREIVEELKRYLDKLTKADKLSGTILLAKNDSILFKGAYGLASKRFNAPNRIDTKFNLGSMNKMFTGVAVAQLVEKGKLSYEDLAGKYLDSTWIQKETAEKVKIKHLLTHTSGLGSFFIFSCFRMMRNFYIQLLEGMTQPEGCHYKDPQISRGKGQKDPFESK